MVSVIIPAFNAERFLRATLDSVFAQSLKDFEVILIDDGSVDRTREVATSYSEVRYHYQPNQGPATARNNGLKLSHGDYLAFLDADDVWHKDMLSSCIHVFEQHPELGAVHTNWLPIDNHGEQIRQASGWQPWTGNIFSRLLIDIPFNSSCILWKHECYNAIGGFDVTPEINDDWLNWLRIAHLGYEFGCVETPLTYVRVHENSLTHRQNARIIQWRIRALNDISRESVISDDVKKRAYGRIYWLMALNALLEDDCVSAGQAFQDAVQNDPSIQYLFETYYAIAFCGNGFLGSEKIIGFRFDRAEQNLSCMLQRNIFSSATPYRITAAFALMSLARIAYGMSSQDAGMTKLGRQYLWRSIATNPTLSWVVQNAFWVLRILLGMRLVSVFASFHSGFGLKADLFSDDSVPQ